MSSCMSRCRDQSSWFFKHPIVTRLVQQSQPQVCAYQAQHSTTTLASCGLKVLNKHDPLQH